MRINLLLIGVKFFKIKAYHLHYGDDPDTGGKSLYLWNHQAHRVVKKLLKVR